MRKFKIGLLSLVLILVLSTATIVNASGSSDVLKRIYGDDAPAVPEVPGRNEDGSVVDADMTAWQAYFKYIRENDPDYYEDPNGYDDEAKGDYDFLHVIFVLNLIAYVKK